MHKCISAGPSDCKVCFKQCQVHLIFECRILFNEAPAITGLQQRRKTEVRSYKIVIYAIYTTYYIILYYIILYYIILYYIILYYIILYLATRFDQLYIHPQATGISGNTISIGIFIFDQNEMAGLFFHI